jgi:hypothetical protein
MQAAAFARLAGTDASMLRITLSLADKALQLQPDNPHYVSPEAVCACLQAHMHAVAAALDQQLLPHMP